MHLKYWLDEAVRLVQQEGYSIREACFRVKLRKEKFENGIRAKGEIKDS